VRSSFFLGKKFGGGSLPILQQYPMLREENPSVFKNFVFESTSPLRAGIFEECFAKHAEIFQEEEFI
jgi:hypothetical protein